MAGFLAKAYPAAVVAALLACITVFAGMFTGPFFWLVGDINFSLQSANSSKCHHIFRFKVDKIKILQLFDLR
jgi:hypothetical protein